MSISAQTIKCVIFGDPVEQSLSPAMHNAAYKAANLEDQYVFLAAHVKPEQLENAIRGAKAMGFRGITCTIPHKVTVMQYLNEVDSVAAKIGAVNTIVNSNDKLTGYNTDWIGVVTPIEKITSLAGKKVAIIGAGGAARAMAYGVTSRGASVTIFARNKESAINFSDFKADFQPLSNLKVVDDMDILMNASPIGMGKLKDQTPVPAEFINSNHIVFDAVYSPKETEFIRLARAKKAKVICGLEMLLYQGLAQYKLYTNQDASEHVMRSILETHAK